MTLANEKPQGIFSKFGDLSWQVVLNILYILAQNSLGVSGDAAANKRAVGIMKATLYASGVMTAFKDTVREPKPTSGSKNSFPSEHTTTFFALSAFVGASRINDNCHFLHDILAGATIEHAYRVGISKISQIKNESSAQIGQMFVVPIIDEKTKGIALIKEF